MPKPSSKPPQHMSPETLGHVLMVLDKVYPDHPMDTLTQHNAYKVLIACLLSLRTKDDVTMPAGERLFAQADTPETMLKLPIEIIQKLIFPVGFYKTKAQTLHNVSAELLKRYQGQVPDSIDELLTLKGVGRKTANLVMGLGHQQPAVCVDVHVFRICNRLGFLETRTPEETETILRAKLPKRYWHILNRVLVRHGQTLCKPIGPRCDVCPVATECQKVNVTPRKVKNS